MKVILVGANGTIGKYVREMLVKSKAEVIAVGKKSGDFQIDIEDAESVAGLYKKVGAFDAVVNASGSVAFVPLTEIKKEDWARSFQSKLLGQINLVQQALPYIREKGSFTLVSGVLSDQFIQAGTIATTVNRALEGFVQASACEMPKGLRINIISPTLMTDSLTAYGDFFPGFTTVGGPEVADAFKKSIFGIQTGQIFKVFG